MKKLLYLIVFLGGAIISVMAYAASGDWGWYNFDENNQLMVRPESAKEGNRKIPNGDCLEMMCEHGCVENEEYEGWCCPNAGNTGDSCTVEEGIYADACCQSGVCEGGLCVSACPEHSSTTVREGAQIGTTGCYCKTGYILNEAGNGCVKGCATPTVTICTGTPTKDSNGCPTQRLVSCSGTTPVCNTSTKQCESCTVTCTNWKIHSVHYNRSVNYCYCKRTCTNSCTGKTVTQDQRVHGCHGHPSTPSNYMLSQLPGIPEI